MGEGQQKQNKVIKYELKNAVLSWVEVGYTGKKEFTTTQNGFYLIIFLHFLKHKSE